MAVRQRARFRERGDRHRAWRAVGSLHKSHDLRQRSAGEEDPVYPFLLNPASVRGGDGAAASTEDPDIARAMFFQKLDDFGEELHVPAVVARDADRPGVLLD